MIRIFHRRSAALFGALFLGVFGVLAISGQTSAKQIVREDFIGTWVLIPEKSRSSLGDKGNVSNQTLDISVKGDEFRVISRYGGIRKPVTESEHLLFLDGRGEVWRIPGAKERKTKTTWQNAKVVRAWSERNSYVWSDGQQIYGLTKDKNELIVDFVQTLVLSHKVTQRLVFHRKK